MSRELERDTIFPFTWGQPTHVWERVVLMVHQIKVVWKISYLNVVLLHSGEPVVLFASQRWDPPGLHLQEWKMHNGKAVCAMPCLLSRCIYCARRFRQWNESTYIEVNRSERAPLLTMDETGDDKQTARGASLKQPPPQTIMSVRRLSFRQTEKNGTAGWDLANFINSFGATRS